MKSVQLANGLEMPQLGLGVWQSGNGEALDTAIKTAINIGYKLIDTASFYENERGVGEAILNSGISREDVFITTKVWNDNQGYNNTLEAFERSLNELHTDYVDLYLVHWPVKGQFIDTWKAMEFLYQQKKVKAIGVSNFLQHHLEVLIPNCKIVPMVNQLEHHPYLVQKSLQAFCKQHKIQFEAWRPLMGGGLGEVELLQALAKKYGKSPAQVVLRWNIQNDIVTIPKSINPKRIAENFDIWNFEISNEDMHTIDLLDKHQRFGPDPDTFV